MKRFRAGTRRASRRGVGDPRVAYLLYGTLAAAYGLSVWAIIRQRSRGERAPTRATAPEVAPRESRAGFVPRALGRPSMGAVHAATAGGSVTSTSGKNSTKGV